MKIELVKQAFNKYELSYKVKTMNWCCKELKDNPIINLENEYDENSHSKGHPSIMLWYGTEERDWEDTFPLNIYYKVKFCPFCGEPIIINIIDGDDISDTYKKLEELVVDLRHKQEDTDSRSEYEKIVRIKQEVNDCIDLFYEITNYNDFNEEIRRVLDKYKLK